MKHDKQKGSRDYTAGIATGYLYARTETLINATVASGGGTVTGPELAQRLGHLLLSKARGAVLDGTEPMPAMRGSTAEGYEVPAAAKAVHVRSRRNSSSLKCKRCGLKVRDRSDMTRHFNLTHRRYRKLSVKQLRAMRRNAKKARAAHLAKLASVVHISRAA